MRKGKRKGRRKTRRASLKLGLALLVLLAIWGSAGEWFVHHPRTWIAEQPEAVSRVLCLAGNPLADITDAFGWTGYDTVYEYDTDAPSDSVFFAGAPKRIGPPAPSDIRILDRGEFVVGWSDSLRHPVWCAYHVTRDARYENAKRPGFAKDKSLPRAPTPNDYTKSGYDRGHMVPNYAIVTRYGESAQRKTFLMSNIAPQSPALNRGAWREIEHRIADLWTARYGEIWVIVGALSPESGGETIPGSGIDVPTDYYQIIISQEGMDVRALALIFSQEIGWDAWPARHIATIDEIERLTGLDFNPELPSFIQDPLESDLPNRLWPIRPLDIIRQIAIRFM